MLGVLLFLPFVGIAERALNRLLPDKNPVAIEPVVNQRA